MAVFTQSRYGFCHFELLCSRSVLTMHIDELIQPVLCWLRQGLHRVLRHRLLAALAVPDATGIDQVALLAVPCHGRVIK